MKSRERVGVSGTVQGEVYGELTGKDHTRRRLLLAKPLRMVETMEGGIFSLKDRARLDFIDSPSSLHHHPHSLRIAKLNHKLPEQHSPP